MDVSTRCRGLVLVALGSVVGPCLGAAPPTEGGAFSCSDATGQPVSAVYVPSGRAFAWARLRRVGDPPPPNRMPASRYVIEINRDVYYLGLQTQRWLYQRECVRIRNPQRYAPAEGGPAPLTDALEREVDCAAMTTLVTQPGASARMLVTAIESDMERLTPERWRSVLPGPLRRVSVASCPGLN